MLELLFILEILIELYYGKYKQSNIFYWKMIMYRTINKYKWIEWWINSDKPLWDILKLHKYIIKI